MSDIDLKILNERKNTLVSKITWHKDKLAELEGELEDINSFLKKKNKAYTAHHCGQFERIVVEKPMLKGKVTSTDCKSVLH